MMIITPTQLHRFLCCTILSHFHFECLTLPKNHSHKNKMFGRSMRLFPGFKDCIFLGRLLSFLILVTMYLSKEHVVLERETVQYRQFLRRRVLQEDVRKNVSLPCFPPFHSFLTSRFSFRPYPCRV